MAVADCYEGMPLRFLASLFGYTDALSSVHEISLNQTYAIAMSCKALRPLTY